MRFVISVLFLISAVFPLSAASPFVGRWDINVPGGRATWLGITEKAGALEVWYQPIGAHCYQARAVAVEGSHLLITLNGNLSLDAELVGEKLNIAQKRGNNVVQVTGLRAPALNRPEPKKWSKPEPLFNGKDLTGFEPIGDPATSHWIVKDGYLTNETKGANLRTVKTFEDFKLHFEVNYPDHANSGFYLRGRYEVQLESEPLDQNPPERRIGAIYGRITPKVELPRTTGVWNTFDVTLVGRTVTIVRNGVTTIDHQEIEGITGGALDANEGEPGPFYIQGDHTGGLMFRNITVSVPAK